MLDAKVEYLHVSVFLFCVRLMRAVNICSTEFESMIQRIRKRLERVHYRNAVDIFTYKNDYEKVNITPAGQLSAIIFQKNVTRNKRSYFSIKKVFFKILQS